MEIERPVAEVETVMNFYYKTVRQTLSSLSEPVVRLENLGNFYVKEKALDKMIHMFNVVLAKNTTPTFQQYAIRQTMKAHLELMKQVKDKLDLERVRRRCVIDKRFNNGPEEKHTDHLEK